MSPPTNLPVRPTASDSPQPTGQRPPAISVPSAYELGGDYRPIGVVRPEELANPATAELDLPVKELEPLEAIPAAPRRALSNPPPYWAYAGEQAGIPPGHALSIELAASRAIMLESEFGLITRDGFLLQGATHGQQEDVIARTVLGHRNWTQPVEIKGRALLPFGRQGKDSYWHFTTGVIANLLLAKRHGLFAQIDHIILPQFKRPVFIEMLRACGLPVSNVITLGEGQHVRFERLRIVSHTGLEESVPGWKWRDLHALGLAAAATETAPSPEKVLIYRRGGTRGFKNGEQVARLCEQHGFQAFDLEGFTFAKQAALFARAKQVIAAHGSALTNIFYCQPGTRVCEIFNPWYTVDYFRNLAIAGGLEHTALVGPGVRPNIEIPSRLHDSIEVDLVLLRTWLEAS